MSIPRGIVMAVIALAACQDRQSAPAPTPAPVRPPLQVVDSRHTIYVDEFPNPRLFPIGETRDLKPLDAKRTVRMAINTWGGWAPLIYANGGLAPGRAWRDSAGGEFQLELVVIDREVDMLGRYALGELAIGWSTVDMLPHDVRQLNNDRRTQPRIVQQVDWSAGGDGIVARSSISSIAELRGKKVTVAQYTPSHYLLLVLLAEHRVRTDDVELVFTADPFQATSAFASDRSLDAAVGWQPELDKLATAGNRVLFTTAERNLIAGLWFARADFAAAHPEIVEGLARGIEAARISFATSETADVAAVVAKAFEVVPADVVDMLGDVRMVTERESAAFLEDKEGLRAIYKLAVERYGIRDATDPASLIQARP